jgi:hypothetical protein
METVGKAREIAEQLRCLKGRREPNLFDDAAAELDRLAVFETAFFQLIDVLREYARQNGEMDARLRMKTHG